MEFKKVLAYFNITPSNVALFTFEAIHEEFPILKDAIR